MRLLLSAFGYFFSFKLLTFSSFFFSKCWFLAFNFWLIASSPTLNKTFSRSLLLSSPTLDNKRDYWWKMVKSSVTIRDWSHDLLNWWEKRLKLNFNIDWCAFSYRYNLFKKLVNFAPLLYLLHLLLVVWHMTVWHSGEENGFTYWIRLEIETIKFFLNTFWTPHFFPVKVKILLYKAELFCKR